MSKTTTKKTISLGNRFLEDARDTHRRVSLYLVNGFQLKGEVVTFDEETILFRAHSKGKKPRPRWSPTRWSAAGQTLGGGSNASSFEVRGRGGGVVA